MLMNSLASKQIVQLCYIVMSVILQEFVKCV